MATDQNTQRNIEYLKELAKTDLDDVHILRRDTAERVLSKERMRLIEEIADGDVESVRDLARRVDRNVSIVSRDLEVLFEADVVTFEQDGRAKTPRLAHENIFVKPVVFNSTAMAEDGRVDELRA